MVTAEVNEAPRGASAANASTFVTLQVGEDLLDRFLKSDPLKAVDSLIDTLVADNSGDPDGSVACWDYRSPSMTPR